jgi:hypothetical protein
MLNNSEGKILQQCYHNIKLNISLITRTKYHTIYVGDYEFSCFCQPVDKLQIVSVVSVRRD